MNLKRVQRISSTDKEAAESVAGPVVYWMNRDQRVQDNWALVYAQALAKQRKEPLVVVHNLLHNFLQGNDRLFAFKLLGLKEVAHELEQLNIPFVLVEGDKSHLQIPKLVETLQASHVVTDMSPLKLQQQWLTQVVDALAGTQVVVEQVDAHNVIPVWEASPKLEYAAYTIRPKIHKLLSQWLVDIPRITKHKHTLTAKHRKQLPSYAWPEVTNTYNVVPGTKAGMKTLQEFISGSLGNYAEARNNPNADGLSGLSPYFHYGMIAPQRAALEVSKAHSTHGVAQSNIDVFIEEAVVRRELSDNFCYYNPNYDQFDGFHAWAQTSLNMHRGDKREYLYSRDQFEQATTHDPLWNSAQLEMVTTGKMHGYMRMYWAKKILEWTRNPEEALEIAIYLNDHYSLDGRDPNGYVGIAWSIGGVHDRAWAEREVFGKVRFMNFNGCKRKFDVAQYIATHTGQEKLV